MRTVCDSNALNKLQTFEESQYFSPDLRERNQLTYNISEERRIAIASAVGLDNMNSNLRIILLRLITKLIFKYNSL